MKALKRKDDAISHAAVDTLCALMQVSIYVSALSEKLYFANFTQIFKAHENIN